MHDSPNQLYIDGTWRAADSGATLEVVDPATGEAVDTIAHASVPDLDAALGSAARGFDTWKGTDAWTRSEVLRRATKLIRERRDSIADVMTEETGKPLAEARAEVDASADTIDWFADEARRIYGRTVDAHSRANRIIVIRQPIGPAALFTAWNFPAILPARKIAAALAAGCSMILKPAEEAPRTAMCLAAALDDAGLAPGVLNIVTGDPTQISRHLIESDVIRKVSLTGSVPVGRELMHLAAAGVKSVSMELGGHAPVLVFEDADLDLAAELCVRAKFRNCGQVCISPTRFYVQESAYDAFLERFVALTRTLRVGDGRDPETDIGPLANSRRRAAIEVLVADAVDKGARILAGGNRPEGAGFDRGFFFEPTVVVDVTHDMALMSDEPFGPVAPVTTFTDLEDGLAKANDTPFGLAAYVFTTSTRTAFLASEGIDAGMIGVNNLVIATAQAPFGGIKQSGIGREGGAEGIDAYLEAKYVNIAL